MKIAQGAEAVLTRQLDVLKKDRISKAYRIPELDNRLRKARTRTEARLLREARRAGVPAPGIISEGETAIEMEFIEGEKIKDAMDGDNFRDLCEKIGSNIGLLHTYGIIHGDLTTSNMILRGSEIFFIDFGLGFASQRAEDKATDLHVLKEALESTHFHVARDAFEAVLNAYARKYGGADKVIKTLSKIEKRGRYSER
jgi:TP53 regulating kinase-like protein